MEQLKELTKRLIANSFKDMLLQYSFEKITIKMITDHANVIRPTFYNHFHDKYELMEWLLTVEVLQKAKECIDNNLDDEAVKCMFEGFYQDREYYRKAFEVTGQNGFEETLFKGLSDFFAVWYMRTHESGDKAKLISDYYAAGIIIVIKYMLFDASEGTSVEDVISFYQNLVAHNIYKD